MAGNMTLLGSRIRRERRKLHLTQVELAARVGCGQQHLSRLERGWAPRFDLSLVRRIAYALAMPPADLLRDVEASRD